MICESSERLVAMKAAEEATKAANDAIPLKRDSERQSDPVKVAAFPKLEQPSPDRPFDGVWYICIVNVPAAHLGSETCSR
jgi:hypothetical protein